MKNKKAAYLVKCAVIAAVYATLTLIFAPISFGFNIFQCRVSEALTILPIFMPEAIPGLFIGCVLANLLGSLGVLDIIFGSLATLISAILTYKTRNKPFLAVTFPVLINAVIVGGYLYFLVKPPYNILVTMLIVGLGQAVSIYIFGLSLYFILKKHKKIF